jgi:cation transport ATPase
MLWSSIGVTNLGIIQFCLSTPVVLYCGHPFYRECYDGLRHGEWAREWAPGVLVARVVAGG